jgi:hypothetical protein
MRRTDWRIQVTFAVLATCMTLAGSVIVFLIGDLIVGRMAASAIGVTVGLMLVGSFLYAYLRG